MDHWLKLLIGSACIVVIAGGTYLAIREYQFQQSKQALKAEADRNARATIEKQLEEIKYSTERCLAMAKETLPIKKGQPARTTQHNADLIKCDTLKRFPASWRQELDFIGIL